MYKDILIQAGLSSNEAIVYEFLLKSGKTTAGEIIKKTPLKRGVVYNTLAELMKNSLVSQKMEAPAAGLKKIAYFTPNHPDKLRDFVKSKEDSLIKAKNTLEANIGTLLSDFNLVSGKPGIRFFEGLEGIKKVINDTLINNTKKEILTFSDVAGYVKYLKKWNQEYYAPKRKELEIHEKVIIPDNETAMEYMAEYIKNPVLDRLTEILFINHKQFPFKTEVNIYENKVSFVTFSDKIHIGVLIENKELYESMKSIFLLSWTTGQTKKQ